MDYGKAGVGIGRILWLVDLLGWCSAGDTDTVGEFIEFIFFVEFTTVEQVFQRFKVNSPTVSDTCKNLQDGYQSLVSG
jgi:hypothetical protein